MRNARVLILVGALEIVASAGVVVAQPVPSREPSATHVFPAGGKRGTTVPVKIGAECLPPGAQLLVFGDGLHALPTLERRLGDTGEPSPRRKPTEIPITYPKQWESTFTIDADAPLGPAFWRLHCAQGGTGSLPFVVGDLPEFIETESNSQPHLAEPVSLPVTVNGQIHGEHDVDYFRVRLQAGQWVVGEMLCRRLGSRLDPNVEWLGPGGEAVAVEETYFGSDRGFALRAPRDGDYLLRISNVSFHGSPAHVYRLNLTTAPIAVGTIPASLAVGAEQEVEVLVFPNALRASVPRRRVAAPPGKDVVQLSDPSFSGTLAIPCDQRPHLREVEPERPDTSSDATAKVMPIPARVTVDGCLEGSDDLDQFAVTLEKGVRYLVLCEAVTPCDARAEVVVRDRQSTVVARLDARDVLSGKKGFEWQPTVTGQYTVNVQGRALSVTELPTIPYRLVVEPAQPKIELFVARDVFQLPQEGRVDLEITAERWGGASGEIKLTATDLPPGLSLNNAVIPANQRLAKIQLAATADVPSSSVTLRLRGRVEVDGQVVEAPVRARHLGHDDEGASIGPALLDRLHVSVQHKPIFRLFCAEAYQYAHRGTVYPYLMEIERLGGFDGEVTVQLGDRQNRDLDGIEMLETKVAGTQTQFQMPIYLPETMHINVQSQSQLYTQGYARFIDKHGLPQAVLVVSEKRNMLRTLPPVIRMVDADSAVEWLSRSAGQCTLRLDRTSNFTGPLEVTLVGGPPGIRIVNDSVAVAAGSSEVHLPLTCERSEGRPENGLLRFRATGRMASGAQAVTEAQATWSTAQQVVDDRRAEREPVVAFQIGRDIQVGNSSPRSPDGKWTIAPTEAWQAQLVEVGDPPRPVGEPWSHREIGRNVRRQISWTFSPDGRYVATALSGDTRGGGDTAANVRVWDLRTKELVAEATPFRYGRLGYVRQMAFSEDGKKLLIRCDDISGK